MLLCQALPVLDLPSFNPAQQCSQGGPERVFHIAAANSKIRSDAPRPGCVRDIGRLCGFGLQTLQRASSGVLPPICWDGMTRHLGNTWHVPSGEL